MIDLDRIHRMDALEGLERLASESVDLVLTDPPYNIASDHTTTIHRGKLMTTKQAWGAWDMRDRYDYELWMGRVISHCHRILKPGGALYMFTAREDNGLFLRRAVERGFVHRNMLALVKKNPLPSFAKSNWRSGFELCFYATKGKPKTFNFPVQSEAINVYAHPACHRHSKHPTEKPLEMMKRIVLASSNPGELVLDPFMGSGTTAVAAKLTGRRYVGFETDAAYLAMAEERLRGGGSAKAA